MPLDRPNQPQTPPAPLPPDGLLPRAVHHHPPAGLILARSQFDQILAHLRASLPKEGCGLLATIRGDTLAELEGPERAVRFYPGTNIDDSVTRYTMDPMEVLAALRDMETNGWRLGAIVHSHPASPPTPSPTDLREAHYQGALMMIVSFAARDPVARAWAIAALPQPEVDTGAPASPFREAPVIIHDAIVERPPGRGNPA
jgi:proteasome lid subunit RPN8/RPN11